MIGRQLVSSFIVSHKPWAWTQWTTLFLAAAIVITVIPMPETYVYQTRLSKEDGGSSMAFWNRVKDLLATILFVRPLHMLIREPIVCAFAFCKFPSRMRA